ncbi:MAG: hypothetical protein ABUK01_05715 [Leptospirales bacterium]
MMDFLYNIVVIVHVVFGAVLFMFSGIMQLVVGPAMSHFQMSPEKKSAQQVLQKRAQRSMHVAIVVMSLTALYLLHSRWGMIQSSNLLIVKVIFGAFALIMANILHFGVRFKRMKLQKSENPEDKLKLDRLKKKIWAIEKIILYSAATAFILGVVFNHLH